MHPYVHSSNPHNSQDMETTQMSIDRGSDQEDVVYRHNGILLSHKNNKIMPFASTWMELETLILSEVRERQIPYAITYTWNLVYGINEPFHKRKENHGFAE